MSNKLCLAFKGFSWLLNKCKVAIIFRDILGEKDNFILYYL